MRKIALLTLAACPAFALDTQPWLGDPYAFSFDSALTYEHFRKVEGASKQLDASSNTGSLTLDLGFTGRSPFDLQIEAEIAKNNTYALTLRSGALQGRYQFLDDIAGDPLSVTFGMNLRGVLHTPLGSVSTPYASECNAEVTTSLGKEWSERETWTMRTYGFAALGIANASAPWIRGLFVWQNNWEDTHRLTVFAEGKMGLGSKSDVDTHHFDGWRHFQYRAIDLGLGYGYHFAFYGTLSASFAYRVFAENYPEHATSLIISYSLPFSWF